MTLIKSIWIVIIIQSIDKCSSITRYSTARPNPDEWLLKYQKDERYQYQSNIRDNRETDDYPTPQLPWEEALRHSIYLTLVRDKINSLLINHNKNVHKGRKVADDSDTNDTSDINLWKEIRKAPFIAHGKDRGPIFGDIAILSRGKLIKTQNEFQFIEDNDNKECIECHIYSARLNELAAEKQLNCDGKDCAHDNVKALWTVRRIRHRNYGNVKSPFRYELMFSIASANTDRKNLDYNIPTQTFTIRETDRVGEKNNYYDNNNVIYTTESYPKYTKEYYDTPNVLNNDEIFSNKQRESYTEKTYWVHRNINHRHLSNNDGRISFPEYDKINLNTGEVYNESEQKDGVRQFNHYNSNNHFSNINYINERGNKKYKDNDKVILESEHIPNLRKQTITHLHHHYYLNDDGEPIVKIPNKEIKSRYQYYIPNMYEEYNTNDNQETGFNNKYIYFQNSNIPQTTDRLEITTLHNGITIPIEPEFINTKKVNISMYKEEIRSNYPMTLQSSIKNKINVTPTKPFKPSPPYIKTTYSELDPLYTLSPPQVDNVQTDFINSNYKDTDSKTSMYILPIELSTANKDIRYSTPIPHYEVNHDITSDNNVQDKKENIEEEKLFEIDKIITENNLKFTTISSTIKREDVTEKPIGRKKNERIRKPTRRTRLQKKFTELVNAQLPPPDKTSITTIPYSIISSVTQPSSDTISEPDSTQVNSVISPTQTMFNDHNLLNINKTNQSYKNSRQRYQRKYNWSSRIKLKTTTPTPQKISIPSSIIPLTINNVNDTEIISTNYDFDLKSHKNKNNSIIINKKDNIETTTYISTTDSTDILNDTLLVFDEKSIEYLNSTNENETESTGSSIISNINVLEPASENTEESSDIYIPHTKKSLVTSISLKLGNKTRPYVPSSPATFIESDKILNEKNNITHFNLLNKYEFKNVKKAQILEIKQNPKFNIFKAEDLSDNYSQMTSGEIENITQQILEHAKTIIPINNTSKND